LAEPARKHRGPRNCQTRTSKTRGEQLKVHPSGYSFRCLSFGRQPRLSTQSTNVCVIAQKSAAPMIASKAIAMPPYELGIETGSVDPMLFGSTTELQRAAYRVVGEVAAGVSRTLVGRAEQRQAGSNVDRRYAGVRADFVDHRPVGVAPEVGPAQRPSELLLLQ